MEAFRCDKCKEHYDSSPSLVINGLKRYEFCYDCAIDLFQWLEPVDVNLGGDGSSEDDVVSKDTEIGDDADLNCTDVPGHPNYGCG